MADRLLSTTDCAGQTPHALNSVTNAVVDTTRSPISSHITTVSVHHGNISSSGCTREETTCFPSSTNAYRRCDMRHVPLYSSGQVSLAVVPKLASLAAVGTSSTALNWETCRETASRNCHPVNIVSSELSHPASSCAPVLQHQRHRRPAGCQFASQC